MEDPAGEKRSEKRQFSKDLTQGFSYTYVSWMPDRTLNPQYIGIDSVPICGINLKCPHGEGHVDFIIPNHPLFQQGWTVVSQHPLSLQPSIHRKTCGCHGYITDGKWVHA